MADIQITWDGDGQRRPFDPSYLGKHPCQVLEQERLTLPGRASSMPDLDTEDAILRLAALGAFLPLGTQASYEPGDEEWGLTP